MEEITTMDIENLRAWFMIVGCLAAVALTLLIVNIFIFKRHQIKHALRGYCHSSPLFAGKSEKEERGTTLPHRAGGLVVTRGTVVNPAIYSHTEGLSQQGGPSDME